MFKFLEKLFPRKLSPLASGLIQQIQENGVDRLGQCEFGTFKICWLPKRNSVDLSPMICIIDMSPPYKGISLQDIFQEYEVRAIVEAMAVELDLTVQQLNKRKLSEKDSVVDNLKKYLENT